MKKSSQTGPKVYTASLPSFGAPISYYQLPSADILFASDDLCSIDDPESGIRRLWQDSQWYFRMPTVGQGLVVDITYVGNTPQVVVQTHGGKRVTLRYYDMIEYGNTGAADRRAIECAIEVLKAWPYCHFADSNPGSQTIRSLDVLAIKGLISQLTADKQRYASTSKVVSVEKALALTHVPEATAIIEKPRTLLAHYGLDLRGYTYDGLQLQRPIAGIDTRYMTWTGRIAASINQALQILFSSDTDKGHFTHPGKLFTGPYKFRPVWLSGTEGERGPRRLMHVQVVYPRGSDPRKRYGLHYVKTPAWESVDRSLANQPYLTTRHLWSSLPWPSRDEVNKIPVYSGDQANPNYVGLFEPRVVFTMLTSVLLDIRDHVRVTQAKFIDPKDLARMKAGIKHLSKVPLYRQWLKDTTLAKRLKA